MKGVAAADFVFGIAIGIVIGVIPMGVAFESNTRQVRAECNQMREYLFARGLMRYELDPGTGKIGLSFGESK